MNKSDFSENAFGRVVRTDRGYYAFIPHPLPPQVNLSIQLLQSLSRADQAIARLGQLGKSFPIPHAIIRPFIRNEAVLSSRIEGTHTTLQGLISYELGQLSFFQDPIDAREVHNYVRALDYGLERVKSLPVSNRLMREMHAILLQDVRGRHLTPGEFRKTQNWIGHSGSTVETARYVPPPVSEMQQCLSDWEKFIHAESSLPALLRIAMVHYQFEAIHPFLDGNGRLGRLVISLLLVTWGLLSAPFLSLSEFIEANRQQYYDCLLGVSRYADWDAWLSFFLDGIVLQSNRSSSRINELKSIRDDYHARVSADRSRKNLNKVIDYLFEQPITTISSARDDLGLGSYTTIQRYFDKLCSFEILSEVTGNQRNRMYQASRILHIIQT